MNQPELRDLKPRRVLHLWRTLIALFFSLIGLLVILFSVWGMKTGRHLETQLLASQEVRMEPSDEDGAAKEGRVTESGVRGDSAEDLKSPFQTESMAKTEPSKIEAVHFPDLKSSDLFACERLPWIDAEGVQELRVNENGQRDLFNLSEKDVKVYSVSPNHRYQLWQDYQGRAFLKEGGAEPRPLLNEIQGLHRKSLRDDGMLYAVNGTVYHYRFDKGENEALARSLTQVCFADDGETFLTLEGPEVVFYSQGLRYVLLRDAVVDPDRQLVMVRKDLAVWNDRASLYIYRKGTPDSRGQDPKAYYLDDGVVTLNPFSVTTDFRLIERDGDPGFVLVPAGGEQIAAFDGKSLRVIHLEKKVQDLSGLEIWPMGQKGARFASILVQTGTETYYISSQQMNQGTDKIFPKAIQPELRQLIISGDQILSLDKSGVLRSTPLQDMALAEHRIQGPTLAEDVLRFQISADGHYLFLERKGEYERIDVNSGQSDRLAFPNGIWSITRDGKALYIINHEGALFRWDGQEKPWRFLAAATHPDSLRYNLLYEGLGQSFLAEPLIVRHQKRLIEVEGVADEGSR